MWKGSRQYALVVAPTIGFDQDGSNVGSGCLQRLFDARLLDTVFDDWVVAAPTVRADGEAGPWLMDVDASANVGQVSAGSATSDRSAMTNIPFLGCWPSRLDSLWGDSFLAGGERLPAGKPSARLEVMISLKLKLSLIPLQVVVFCHDTLLRGFADVR